MTINPLIAAKPSFRAAVRRAAVAACLVAASAPAALADTSGGGEIHPPGLPCGYTVEVIERPECPDPFFTPKIWVQGLNESGTVVGYRDHCDADSGTTRDVAWVWEPGDTVPTDLPLPPEIHSSRAYDLNDEGLIVGEFKRYLEPWRGFVYDTNTGEWTELEPVDPTGSGTASANAINNAGVVAGTRSIGNTKQPYNAFTWSADDGYTDLGVMEGPNSAALDLSNVNCVTGWTGQASHMPGAYGFAHCVDKQTELLPFVPGATSSAGLSINDVGLVAGGGMVDSNPNYPQAAIWNAQEWLLLPSHSACENGATSRFINNDGIAAGHCAGTGGDGLVWIDGEVFNVNDLIVNEPEITVSWLLEINDSGQLLARAKEGGTSLGVVLTKAETPLGDLNGDCEVGPDDLGLLLSEWSHRESPADLTGDGTVGGADLGVLLSNWTK